MADTIRLMNTVQNLFVGMVPKIPQKAVFIHGKSFAEGLEGGFPMWPYAEFTISPQQTQQTRIQLPANFVLLAYLASSSLAGGARVQIYDVNRQMRLVERPANFQNLAGIGASPLFLREPYYFVKESAEVLVRVTNLDATPATNNTIQVVLHGVEMPEGSQP